MTAKTNRSPLFYVGDKYRLMGQLTGVFPTDIGDFYEPFVGGGTVFLNVRAGRYFLNDIDRHLISIHKFLVASAKRPEKFFSDVEKIIRKYNLSRSYKEDIVPDRLKRQFKKTYYARFNKAGYEKLRSHVNRKRSNDPLVLYVLLIYGFNRMLRFNGAGKFNLPVGNVDFNRNVVAALDRYFDFIRGQKAVFTAKDFRSFLDGKDYAADDFVYLDPPYLIASSEYNKLWGEEEELSLLDLVDDLDSKGIRFALSNVTHYNGDKNDLLIKWAKRYNVHRIRSNYISYHHNRQKPIKEVLVTNY